MADLLMCFPGNCTKGVELSKISGLIRHMSIDFLFHLFLVLWLTKVIVEAKSIAKPGCQERCGNVSIPYPFGIGGRHCYKNGFAVTCRKASGHHRPFLESCGMELLGVSITGLIQVNNPVNSENCGAKDPDEGTDLTVSPFYFSATYNRFTATGCDNYAYLVGDQGIVGGCLSTCRHSNGEDGCYGINCCQTTIPPYLKAFGVFINRVLHDGSGHGCRSALLVDQNWFSSVNLTYVRQKKHVPAVLEWGTDQGVCEINKATSLSFCSSNGYCWTDFGNRHLCVCKQNTTQSSRNNISYISGACEGCEDSNDFNCRLLCLYTPYSNGCKCPRGYTNIDNSCYPPSYPSKIVLDEGPQVQIIIVGCVSGIGIIVLFMATWCCYQIMKRRKTMKLKQKYFKRNGGLLLQQKLYSQDMNIDQIKIFSSKELEKATEHFNENRILGQGGQGTVYKGMLIDGRIVAIKKSKIVDEGKLEQFINEVVILSQVNHRNVVKLLGCCLETEVPLLVCEFIPNGTLFDHLQNAKEEFPITWKMRLQIATDVADAISYLHSAAVIPIYHRDIKSTNILLDDKYRAKVSDFGTSKSIQFDQTHVTTRVQGTFGYVDPEYFRSSRFTEKSDVYSFGVVLIELLTGETPISSTRSPRQKGLVAYFLLAMEGDYLFEIVDAQILKEAKEKEVEAVAKLAERCVSIIGRERPTMKAVAMELETIKNTM